jgi:predicted DNA-binding transcriptional regulator AlpA
MQGHWDPKAFDASTASNRPALKWHVREMKARQTSRIAEFRATLHAAGLVALDEQASALGVGRSTVWTILQGKHKSSGLSAAIINRMMKSPHLPSSVRAKIVEYVEEKTVGLYGHSSSQLRKFKARLSIHAATKPKPEEGFAPESRLLRKRPKLTAAKDTSRR